MTYKKQSKYWKTRKINWEESYFNLNHPHRQMILEALEDFRFRSVLEIGCGAGANLKLIQDKWPAVHLGGVDINDDAITAARRLLPNAHFLETAPAHDIFFGYKSTDVVISDACLIYYSPIMIRKMLNKIKEIARIGVVFCELHSESWWDRQRSKYYVYNYRSLLESMGFYAIELKKIENWEGYPWKKWGYIIKARIV